MTTPSSWYEPSPRRLPRELPQLEYPLYTFRAPANGVLPWRGQNVYISNCLAEQTIALERVEDETWSVYFCNMRLGRITRVDNREQSRAAFIRVASVERVDWQGDE
jgi:putative transposase